MGNSSVTGQQTVTFTDNLSFDGTERGGALDADGQQWFGSTSGRHVVKGILTGSTGVVMTPSSGGMDVGTPSAVQGPVLAADGNIPVFDTTTGLLIRDSGAHIAPAGVNAGTLSVIASATSGMGVYLSNTGAGANAGTYLAMISSFGDAVMNVGSSLGEYQWGCKTADSAFYIAMNNNTFNHIDGTVIFKIDQITSTTARFNTIGGEVVSRVSKATDYNVLNSDYYIGVTSTAAPRSIVLPVTGTSIGQIFEVKDESGGAATNNITITVSGGALIDSSASLLINANYQSFSLIFNGTNYFTY